MRSLCYLLLSFLFIACIGEDIVDDIQAEEVRITNSERNLIVGSSLQLNAIFLDNVGNETTTDILWESSNPEVLSVNNNGVAEGLALGTATVTASVNTISDQIEINVTDENDGSNPTQITGNIFTTSSYDLTGNFTLSETTNNGLDLMLADNYIADTALPGLYVYLTNNPNSIANALEIGPVTVFSGEHNYLIPNTGINDYSHILYWCKPFSVKVGQGNLQE